MIGDKKVTPAIVINGGGTPIHNQTIEERIESNGYYEYTPDAGYTGLDRVALSVDIFPEINNQDKTVTENGVYTPDEGYTGLGTVTVNVEGGGTGTIYGMDPKAFLGFTDSDGTIVRSNDQLSVDFGNATAVGAWVYTGVFRGKQIESFVGNNITSVDVYAFSEAFKDATVYSLSFPNLQTVGINGLYRAFENASIYGLDIFSKIQTVEYMGFADAFSGAAIKNITDIRFDSLTLVDQYGFSYAFSSAQVESGTLDIWFPKLQEVRYSGFAYITDDNTRGTIRFHFPSALQSVIESQEGYPWPHTETLFDADGYPCTFGLVYPTLYTLPLVIFNDKDITDTKVGYITKSGTNRLIAILQKNATGKRWVISPKMNYIEGTESYTYNINGMQDTGDRYEGSAHIVCTNATNATFTLFVDGHEIMSETGAECTFYANTYNLFPGRFPFDAKVVVRAEGYASSEIDITFSAAGTASTEYSVTLEESQDVTLLDTAYPFTDAISSGALSELLGQGENPWVVSESWDGCMLSTCKTDNGITYGKITLTNLNPQLATRMTVTAGVSSEQNYDWLSVVLNVSDLSGHDGGWWQGGSFLEDSAAVVRISGHIDIQEYTGTMPKGYETLYAIFCYSKDSSSESGRDEGCIRSIKIEQISD